MHRRVATAFALILACVFGAPTPARAQILGVHGVWVPAANGRRESFGFSGDFGWMTGAGPVGVWGAIGGEYQRQRDLGPGRGRASADFRFIPARIESKVVPFVGASLSANWSGGEQSEWNGTRTGYDALAGLLLIRNERSHVALSLQERWGYIDRLPHAWGTELGLRFSLR